MLHNLKLIILSPNTTIRFMQAYLAITGNKKASHYVGCCIGIYEIKLISYKHQ